MAYRVKVLWFILSTIILPMASKAYASVPNGFGTVPIFSADFTEESQLNPQVWSLYQQGIRKNCVDVESAIKLQHGHLTIKTYSNYDNAGNLLNNYCGMISTQRSFLSKYGYWEASVRFNYVFGFQLAFWLQSPTMGENIHNPESSGSEIDIFEHTGYTHHYNEVDNAIYWNGYRQYESGWSNVFYPVSINDGIFHTVGLAWTPQGYTFYLDDQIVAMVSSPTVPVSTAKEFIILSTEVPQAIPEGFGSFGLSSATFDVKYVKVYPLLNVD